MVMGNIVKYNEELRSEDSSNDMLGDIMDNQEEFVKGICSGLEDTADILNSGEKIKLGKATCSCGKAGKPRVDSGLSCGIHCDECFTKLVSDCRSRS